MNVSATLLNVCILRKVLSRMEGNPEKLLRSMFEAAVSRALPEHTLRQYLPPKPKGRTIIVGAGKGAAAMVRAVESEWEDHGVRGEFIS